MLIPKEALVWIRAEEAIPGCEESEHQHGGKPGESLFRVPGISLLLKNNLCLTAPIPYAQAKAAFADGWLDLDETDIHVVVNNINGTRDFIGWLEYCLNQSSD
jgi:hypothetical protein